ncbi:MAG TPA: conjugative transposon protein TraK [Puia sp.]|nr:conjugative transposon protein TraK [Puia sp.]
MFQTFKNIDQHFRQLRTVTIVAVLASVVVSGIAIYASHRFALGLQNRIYLLADGKVLEAYASDRRDNVPAEARDHVRTFHELLFTMDPDEKLINANAGRAMYLADGSGKQIFDNLRESGYIAAVVSGNISQAVTVDSIRLDMDSHPYHFHCFATETIIRMTSVTIRRLETDGWLREVSRSDNNPHGFLIEKLVVLDNRDIRAQNRTYEK